MFEFLYTTILTVIKNDLRADSSLFDYYFRHFKSNFVELKTSKKYSTSLFG